MTGELIEWLTRDIESIDEAFSSFPDAVVLREEWIAPRAAEVIAALARVLRVPLTTEASVDIAHRYHRDRVRESVQLLSDRHGWSDHFRHYDAESHWHANHIAPDGHEPLALSAPEREQLDHLARIVDGLTARHSLLAGAPDRWHARATTPVSHEFLRAAAPARRLSMLARLRQAAR